MPMSAESLEAWHQLCQKTLIKRPTPWEIEYEQLRSDVAELKLQYAALREHVAKCPYHQIEMMEV